MNELRKPAVAGMFYPSNPKKLRMEIETLLSISQPAVSLKNIFGLVIPHAGYIYSGRTAAFGFNLIKNMNYKTIIIISPSHREYFRGISIYDGDAYQTPLGNVKINKEIAGKIIASNEMIFEGKEGHVEEHAIEVLLPFLQFIYSDFLIVPIVMGMQDKKHVNSLAESISHVADDNTLIIASSDLSHYYNKETADKLDSVIEQNILDFNFDKLQNDLDNAVCEACGGGPITAVMKAAWLSNFASSVVLNRSDSSFTSKDTSQVVGYLSAAFYRN
jgi:AmmeMemoRadiSam system protein B